MTLRHLRRLALLPLLGTGLLAQQPSNWTTTSLPPNATSINSIGTTSTFRTPDAIWLFSGVTKRWTVLQVHPAATLFQANDYCIVQDGPRIHGFASHTGKVDTLVVNGPVTVVSGPASSSWVTLVREGKVLHGFAAFRGTWTSTRIQGTTPTMLANRLVGLCDDGVSIHALSAHHGEFVSTPSSAGTTLSVVGEGEIATAHAPNLTLGEGEFRAFSAQQNRWLTTRLPSGFTTRQSNEFAMAWSGTTVVAASGLNGQLKHYQAQQPVLTVSNGESNAAFVDGGLVVCYGAGQGTFATIPATSPTFLHKYHFVFVNDSGTLTPFSSLTGTFGAPLTGNFAVTANDEVAFVDDGTSRYAYSSIRNTWTQAPSVGSFAVAVVRAAVVIAHGTGYLGFSTRYGTWVPLTTTQTFAYTAPATGSTVLVDDVGNTLHVFDSRLNRWASVSGIATMTKKISRHTAMAHDGSFGYGFGQPSGEWFVEPLTQAPSGFDTASSIGSIRHGNQLSVYSVQGSFSYTGRFPEFTQAINLGNTLRLHQVAPAGSTLWQIFGDSPAYQPTAPFGMLYVEPSTASVYPLLGVVGADGYHEFELPVPPLPSLAGAQLHLQNVVFPPVGSPWLSSSVAPVLF